MGSVMCQPFHGVPCGTHLWYLTVTLQGERDELLQVHGRDGVRRSYRQDQFAGVVGQPRFSAGKFNLLWPAGAQEPPPGLTVYRCRANVAMAMSRKGDEYTSLAKRQPHSRAYTLTSGRAVHFTEAVAPLRAVGARRGELGIGPAGSG